MPYPYAAHDHQLLNAEFMEKAGASVLVEEKNLTEDHLRSKINGLMENNQIEPMSRASADLARPDAAKEIVEQLYSLIGK